MTDLENHYYALSEVYLAAYKEIEKPIYQIAVAQGVVAEMLFELIKHERTYGQSEKSKATNDRINILMKALESFDRVTMNNIQLKHRLKTNMGEIAFLRDQVKEYEEKIKNMTELLQAGL